MAKVSNTPSMRFRIVYVDARSGWREFFVSLLIAAVLGLGFRLYFSPPRLKAWITTALEQQKRQMAHPFALSFNDVQLRLSDGLLPQLAIVVTDVKVAPNPECHPEASVFIGELRLPFRLFSLLSGRAAIGVIGARDIRVDLDGLRAQCELTAARATLSTTPATSATSPTAKPPAKSIKLVGLPMPAMAVTTNTPLKPWWTDEQFKTVRGFVEGLEFSRAVLQFENQQKEIYLDSFSALFMRSGRVQLNTEVRIPPHVTYGEQLPPLRIEGEATNLRANLLVSARVSEGSLATTAVLTPAENQSLLMTAQMTVKSLPLSMLSPFMRKAGLADGRFQPKFLWLDCSAMISGPFQGLFQASPLKLEACRIEGDGTDIQMERAERSPNGVWKPFDVSVLSLDLAKLFATIGVHGPDGVADDFGQLIGTIHVESAKSAAFKGQLRNANISFSNRKVRASQKIESATVNIGVTHDRVTAVFNDFSLVNGELAGGMTFDLERDLRQGKVAVDIQKLRFDPAVQKVLVGGDLGLIEGFAKAKIEGAQISDFDSQLKIGATRASDYAFEKLTVAGDREGEAPPSISIDSPTFEINRSSMIFKAIEPLFFSHEFSQDSAAIALDQPHIELHILEKGVVEWAKTKASMAHGQILFSSSGTMNRDHQINGLLQVDYPKIKKLKWKLSGLLESPSLQGTGEEITQLKSRAEIDDKVLGLKF
jgi:hypothetical protein